MRWEHWARPSRLGEAGDFQVLEAMGLLGNPKCNSANFVRLLRGDTLFGVCWVVPGTAVVFPLLQQGMTCVLLLFVSLLQEITLASLLLFLQLRCDDQLLRTWVWEWRGGLDRVWCATKTQVLLVGDGGSHRVWSSGEARARASTHPSSDGANSEAVETAPLHHAVWRRVCWGFWIPPQFRRTWCWLRHLAPADSHFSGKPSTLGLSVNKVFKSVASHCAVCPGRLASTDTHVSTQCAPPTSV